jgi:V/A-type H+-transporting ATPase subunit I
MATMLDVGLGLLGGGALLVFLFSGAGSKPLKRMVQGLFAFTRVSKAFGDILSYLRLFALGLASASLAMAFNGMAGQIREAVPGVGLLFALVVLLLGHTINVVLAVASGVIHGLRLNVIEFFDWGAPDEGRLYKPFKRKETVPWNP